MQTYQLASTAPEWEWPIIQAFQIPVDYPLIYSYREQLARYLRSVKGSIVAWALLEPEVNPDSDVPVLMYDVAWKEPPEPHVFEEIISGEFYKYEH